MFELGLRQTSLRIRTTRGYATVQDTPVRRYGGLKDQDRIFTNAYCRHDHGIKGAQVSSMQALGL
jgi:NADH dehydrogenase (ubiquinone) flavoprotein 1